RGYRWDTPGVSRRLLRGAAHMNGALAIGEVLSTAFRRFTRAQAPVIAYIVGLAIIETAVSFERDPTDWGWPHFVGYFLAQNWLWWSMLAAALKTADNQQVGLGAFGIGLVTFIQLIVVTIVMTIPVAL